MKINPVIDPTAGNAFLLLVLFTGSAKEGYFYFSSYDSIGESFRSPRVEKRKYPSKQIESNFQEQSIVLFYLRLRRPRKLTLRSSWSIYYDSIHRRRQCMFA